MKFVLIVCSCLLAKSGAFNSVATPQRHSSILFYDTKGDSHVEKHHDVRPKVAEWIEKQISGLEPRSVMPESTNKYSEDDISKWLSNAFAGKDPISDNWFNYALTQKPSSSLKGSQIQDNEEVVLQRKSFQGLVPDTPPTSPLPIGSIKNFHLAPIDQKTLTSLSTTDVVREGENLGEGMWFSQASPTPVQKDLHGANNSELKPGSTEWFSEALYQSKKDDISEWLSDAFANVDPVSDNWFGHALTQEPSSSLKKGTQIQDNEEVVLQRKSFQGLVPEMPQTSALPIGSMKNFHLAPIDQKTLTSLSTNDAVRAGENLFTGMWFSQASPAPVQKDLHGANNSELKPGSVEWFSEALYQSKKDDISEWLSDAFANVDPVSDNWFGHALTQEPSSLLKKGTQIQDNEEAVLKRKSFQGLLPEIPMTAPLPIRALKNFHLAPIDHKTLMSLSTNDAVRAGENLGDGMWFSQKSPVPLDENLLGANDSQLKPGCTEWFSVALSQ